MKHARQVLDAHQWQVDYVLSHEVYENHSLGNKYKTDMNFYDPERYDLKPFLQEIEERLDYRVWLHGHYHVDQIERSPSNKPCITLYNRVITIPEIEELYREICE